MCREAPVAVAIVIVIAMKCHIAVGKDFKCALAFGSKGESPSAYGSDFLLFIFIYIIDDIADFYYHTVWALSDCMAVLRKCRSVN